MVHYAIHDGGTALCIGLDDDSSNDQAQFASIFIIAGIAKNTDITSRAFFNKNKNNMKNQSKRMPLPSPASPTVSTSEDSTRKPSPRLLSQPRKPPPSNFLFGAKGAQPSTLAHALTARPFQPRNAARSSLEIEEADVPRLPASPSGPLCRKHTDPVLTESEESGANFDDREDDLAREDMDSVKRQLNERAELSHKTTATLRQAEPTSRRGTIDDFAEQMRQYRAVIEQNNRTIKDLSEEYQNAKERFAAELDIVKQELAEKSKETRERDRLIMEERGRAASMRTTLTMALQNVSDCRGTLKNFIDFSDESVKLMNDTRLIDQERLLKYQLSLNYVSQLARRVDIGRLDSLLRDMAAAVQGAAAPRPEPSTSVSSPQTPRKYTEQLQRLRAENFALTRQASELEQTMEKLPRGKDGACWEIYELVTARKEAETWKEKYLRLTERYESLLRKPTPQSKINKLAQILAYLPKRRREFRITEERTTKKLIEELERLRQEMERREQEHRRREQELLKQIEDLTRRVAQLEKENGELRRKIAELLGILRLKDELIAALRHDLDLARQQIAALLAKIDKLMEELRNKDMIFAEKMKEMKAIFEEMRREKEEKQKEIILLRNRVAELEAKVAELKAEIERLLAQIRDLTAENESLRGQLEKYMSPEALDGFRAMIALANMVLARSKRPPPLSNTDKQLIKDIFDNGSREMLDEIARLEDELKVCKEELRRVLSERQLPLIVFRKLLEVGYACENCRNRQAWTKILRAASASGLRTTTKLMRR